MNCSSHEQELCQILVQNSSVINNKLNVAVVLNSAVLQKKSFRRKMIGRLVLAVVCYCFTSMVNSYGHVWTVS